MNGKKPKGFGFYFLKHGMVFLILWLIMAYIGFKWFDNVNEQQFVQLAADSYFSYKENIMQLVNGDTMAKKEAAISVFLPNANEPVQFEDMVFAASSYIIDQETGEIVGLTDRCYDEYVLFCLLERNRLVERQRVSGEAAGFYENVYYCDKETLKDYLEDLGERLKAWKTEKGEPENPGFQVKYILKVESFYSKDAYFLPGKITVLYQEINVAGVVRKEEVLATLTYAPEHPEEYEYRELDYEKEYIYGDLAKTYSEDQAYQSKWHEMRGRAMAMQSELEQNPYNDYYDPWKCSEVGNNLLGMSKARAILREFLFADGTGHVYKAVFYFESDTFSSYLYYGLWEGLGTLAVVWFVCFVCAFLAAEWEYRKKRYQYVTEGYRNMLVDSMAHDLKSPLMAISGYAENLMANLKENQLEKSEYYAGKIYDNAGYVNTLITANLEALRYDHQTKKLVKQKLGLRKLFEEAVERHQGELAARNLHVTMEGESWAKGDEEMLQRVAENLIANCIRYGSKESEIRLSFGKNKFVIQNQTELTYHGNLKKLWEPFVRGEESRSGKGTGLGLAIVANVLDRHGWKYSLGYDKEKKIFTCTIKFSHVTIG
ncbi:MAG: HAMP domain-containing histidine kinase [Lachnospiraceae bacterium]|nr:HAMP domain-containing histidine kinase [Lachnospiraceae bacterium]